MHNKIPLATIQMLARSISREASNYGFGQLDVIRLINELMDNCTTQEMEAADQVYDHKDPASLVRAVTCLPLIGERLIIRSFDADLDMALFDTWLADKYGRYFVLSSTAAQSVSMEELANDDSNHLGIITTLENEAVGALAYLDHDTDQKRAELRKLIGNPEYRGIGFAEDATRLWIAYGISVLGLQKINVSTLQTHISNIKLNEKIGFQVEGLLRDEVLIDGARHDVLRMGYYID